MPIDRSLYNWHPRPNKANIFRRHALGPETKWASQALDIRKLYLSGLITLETPCPSKMFGKAARIAWLRLRYEHPEVVMGSNGDFADDGSAIIECEIPADEYSAEDWMRRTLTLGTTLPDLGHAKAMRSAERKLREKRADDTVQLLLDAISSEGDSQEIGAAAFSFCVGHQMADGIGTYIVAGAFLDDLAKNLGGRTEQFLDWRRAAENIPEPWVQMMNSSQQEEGKEFEESAKRTRDLVFESYKGMWGMNIRSLEPYAPRSMAKTLAITETKAIMGSVKTKLGPGFSITHLGHAAMVMTALKLKPLDERPSSNRFISPVFINGRRYLTLKDPWKGYVPMCRAFGAIDFRDVARYTLSEKANKEEIQQRLKVACEEARRSYQAIRDQTSLLTESFAVTEVFKTTKTDLKPKDRSDAFFLSDGIVEQYISRAYTNETGDCAVFSVDGVRFVGNPDGPALIIRMCTFRDCLRLSAEWNGACRAEDDVREFLKTIVAIMQIFT